ncbi:MAG TPA: ThuA domain-containing protein [Actinomycetota bacterium]|nr:ThuA domain-containing protein [Actinomycetota bacterium]
MTATSARARPRLAAPLALGLALAAPLAACGETGGRADPAATSTAPATTAPATTATTSGGSGRVLVFSKTTGFRHQSIPDGIGALRDIGAQLSLEVDATEDASRIADASLARYQAVVFLSTTGDLLDDDQKAALQRYVRAGHGWLGIHAAADAEYRWAWYAGLVGAQFRRHPAVQQATVVVDPIGRTLVGPVPQRWQRTDEWYDFRTNPRGKVRVLATVDETTYTGGGMGADHPIAWCHDYEGGRSWYTGMGHTNESFKEPLFLAHLSAGVRYVTGQSGAGCAASG